MSIAQKGIDLASTGLSGGFFIFLVPEEGDKHFVPLVEIIKSSQGAAAAACLFICWNVGPNVSLGYFQYYKHTYRLFSLRSFIILLP